MLASNSWHLFREWWPMSVTMVIGSTVAGATAEGGGAVAFPVFTKLLHIPSTEARTFGLMIQAVGMTMASVVILVRRVRILPRVIATVTIGGAAGMVVGTYFLAIPNPYPKVLFTMVTAIFGVALLISRYVLKWPGRLDMPNWGSMQVAQFLALGFAGGAFSSNTGTGTDMMTFVVLTLAYGISEKVSTPTTVIIMGLNSVVGFATHLVRQDIGIVWEYWLVCVPIVILGAPFGAYIASKVARDTIINFLLALITLELVTTLLLIPFTAPVVSVTLVVSGAAALWFWSMLYYRQKYVPLDSAPVPD